MLMIGAYWYSSKVTVGSTRAVRPQTRSWIGFVGFSTLTDSRGSATGSTSVPTAILTRYSSYRRRGLRRRGKISR